MSMENSTPRQGRGIEAILNILALENQNEKLGSEDAIRLVNSGHIDDLVKNLDKFEELNTEVALGIIDKKDFSETVMKHKGRFSDLNYDLIFNKLKQENELYSIWKDPTFFKNYNSPEDFLYTLIEQGNYTSTFIEHLENFNIKDYKKLANKLIDIGEIDTLEVNLEKFKNLDSEIANKMIEFSDLTRVGWCTDSFENLDLNDIGMKLIRKGQADSISDRIEIFDESLPKEIVQILTSDYMKKFKYEISVLLSKNVNIGLSEIENKYDSEIRQDLWDSPGVLEKDDQPIWAELSSLFGKSTITKLWKDHDSNYLHIIGPKLIKIYQSVKNELGYTPDTFRGEYIERIINDNSKYIDLVDQDDWIQEVDISSLIKFNNITEGLNDTSRVAILKDASTFEQTKNLAEKLLKENPYKNWENLKKYYELAELLKRRDVLERLETLKKQGKDKQYKFFSDLAFHPGSKISMQTVFQFMESPERFLDVEDDHSGEAHERKKPSNYTRFNYLDINAEDLRDALVEGTLDKLQYFKPFEAGYKIADKNYSKQDIVELLKNGLGSFREKIKGNAKNDTKLFKVVQDILKTHNIEYKNLIANPNLLTNKLRADLERVLFNKDIGIKDERKFEEYLVKIHPKSSPEGHLAGNDTACCMPFGSGKNNVYMYNLGCSILTVQRKSGDSYRTIAQSVLTPDVDINHSISDLVGQVKNETLLSNVINEDLTQKKKIIITADNIEVAPNAEKFKSSIELIYADFVSRYAHEINSEELEQNRMLIGKGYSDLNFSRSKSIENTFIPITPVAYSDNYGEEVYELPLTEKSEIIPLPNYGFLQKHEKQVIDPNLPRGLSYLTAHDTLRVSYMEGKVYAENESLVQYIHRIGNELTAKDINNNFKNRPNLSLKIEDERGVMLGYMIAYEGAEKSYDHGDIDDEIKISTGEKVIYISDLAADTTKSKLAGGKLINTFGELINREYLQKGNALPIVAQARENTSYKIIQKHLSELGQKYGYRFELEENGSYESGGETMYQIKLKPVRI